MRPLPTRLDDEVYAALRARSERTGRSMNALVNELLHRELLGENGAGIEEGRPVRAELRTRALAMGALARHPGGEQLMDPEEARRTLAELPPLLDDALPDVRSEPLERGSPTIDS